MSEHVYYKNTKIKIGTCENLYYTTYQHFSLALYSGQLSIVERNLHPSQYAQPDSGFRFRFPFPDEDKIQMGYYKDFDRGVPIKVDYDFDTDTLLPRSQGLQTLELVQQKLVRRASDGTLCLAVVLRNPINGNRFRLEDDPAIDQLLCCIIKHHILNEKDTRKKQFYQTIGKRILKEYRLENTVKQKYLPKRHPPEGLGGILKI